MKNCNNSNNFNIKISSIDNTNLFKSCVKTVRARKKATGEEVPNARIFPSSNGVFNNVSVKVNSRFFQIVRDIHKSILKHRQLLKDHRRRYFGQMNDPSSMTEEECAHMEQIVAKNIETINKQITDHGNCLPTRSFNSFKKQAFAELRLDHPDLSIGSSVNETEVPDIERCMSLMIILLQSSLQDLNSYFLTMKENRQKKLAMKAKLMRFHRPASVKKASELKRQSSSTNEQKGNNIDKETVNGKEKDFSNCPENLKEEGKYSFASENCHNKELEMSKENKISNGLNSNSSEKTVKISRYEEIMQSLSPAQIQMLEQENDMIYNEFQSTHEEVKKITKQVVELGKLQSVLMENVEEQAIVADNILDSVLHATDDVQEGNEQIREAMRKDAGFRVGIMIFLIVMSFTILFLDWYND